LKVLKLLKIKRKSKEREREREREVKEPTKKPLPNTE
jgi:hypothetical protein